MNSRTKKVGYVFSRDLLDLANKLPPVQGRAFMVHQLIGTYGLLKKCHQIPVHPITDDEELRKFHTLEYLDFIKKVSDKSKDDENCIIDDPDCETFGLNYDCPPFRELYPTVSYLAASTMAAANAISEQRCDVAINWFGGWHHGFKDEASGYCYTNDIVFGILKLLESGFKRILYIDLDLHHGNGVEEAFAHTDKVLTWSIHKYEFGFFPGTGAVTDIGYGTKGKYYAINLPLGNGITDPQYINAFDTVAKKLIPSYKPQVIICQCGADTLSGDKMNSFNLTIKAPVHCVETILSFEVPLIILGGGGYKFSSCAKLWTSITAKVLGQSIDPNIPDHELFLHYGPDYELSITESMIPNENDQRSIDENITVILRNIEKISNSPPS